MSELAEDYPSFNRIDAPSGVGERHEPLPDIHFDDIATALCVVDETLRLTNTHRYLQELRIIEVTLAYLDIAKNCFNDHDYTLCRMQLEAIIDIVKPTNNHVLLAMLQRAHDMLY